MTLITKTPDETIELGKRLGSMLQKSDVIALQGTLAAGKTTITKGIAIALGIDEPITSPTFTLISEYPGRLPLYHMDVYRLDTTDDFVDLGVEELLYGNGVCVVEWSEKVMKELPASTIRIKLEARDDGSREITIDNWKYGDLNA